MGNTLDGDGRTVIPEDGRARTGRSEGQRIEISEGDGQVVVDPTAVPMRAERRGPTLVAATTEPMPVLTVETVREVLEQIRRSRIPLEVRED